MNKKIMKTVVNVMNNDIKLIKCARLDTVNVVAAVVVVND